MDILIHVGLHKTGTTSAQKQLYQKRECLLNAGVLYPTTGLYGCQHALFPGCLIPNHFFLDRVERSLNVEHYISELQKEVKSSNPQLVILSSEVFSEITHQRESCLGLIRSISKDFNSTQLLVTLRNTKALALSAVKHAARERMDAWLINPTGSYIQAHDSIANLRDFWLELDLPISTKAIENASTSLVDHYFGDAIDRYSHDARKCLSENEPQDSMARHERLNSDRISQCTYMILFLAGNNNNASLLLKKPVFSLIARAISSELKFHELPSIITTAHLIGYLEHFRSLASTRRNYSLATLSLDDKVEALQAAKVPESAINDLIQLAREIIPI
jgi:hypothetical protein